ncbi:MAG: plastocyanin/azurin family copper-binding protein [Gemmatimonadaceae bacterium]
MLSTKILWGLSLALVAAACSTEKRDAPEAEGDDDARAPTAATGKIIEVKMITDDKGNYYEPAAIHAETGDVLRFTVVTGVHNVNFLPDSNAGKQGLPPASDLLQLPGQTLDIPVTFAEGSYYFQCDPHALLGMIGRLHVEDDDDDDDND